MSTTDPAYDVKTHDMCNLADAKQVCVWMVLRRETTRGLHTLSSRTDRQDETTVKTIIKVIGFSTQGKNKTIHFI